MLTLRWFVALKFYSSIIWSNLRGRFSSLPHTHCNWWWCMCFLFNKTSRTIRSTRRETKPCAAVTDIAFDCSSWWTWNRSAAKRVTACTFKLTVDGKVNECGVWLVDSISLVGKFIEFYFASCNKWMFMWWMQMNNENEWRVKLAFRRNVKTLKVTECNIKRRARNCTPRQDRLLHKLYCFR